MTIVSQLLAALLLSAALGIPSTSFAETKFVPNYDEAKVPKYTLPDPLLLANGKKVTSVNTWQQKRRPEILRLFETDVYGRAPTRRLNNKTRILSENKEALNGQAIRKEVEITFFGNGMEQRMVVLVYLPRNATRPVPLFLGMNFYGNHTIHSDPGITLSTNWMRSNPEMGIVNNRATEASRGKQASRWPVELILQHGFGLATIYYGDIVPDDATNGLSQGIDRLFSNRPSKKPSGEEWGAIAAWAWGLSQAMDYFETDAAIDAKKVAVMGHSRLGKTALWAGATDQRFALVISNNSGCGGAALSRRKFGETVERINTSFPHWFCGNFKTYNQKEENLPVDQHQLIALIAPRPVYVASAEEDRWADPLGEFLAAKHAGPVYKLFGKNGVGVETLPDLNRPVGDFIGYHIRTGKHDVTDFDWEQYLSFAKRHFGQR